MQDFPAPIRVLLVDDDPDLATITATYLQREDDQFTVETAIGAEAALERLDDGIDCVVSDYEMPEKNGIDCVVSDYEMPEKNGIELLEAVRETYPDLPFILYTGRGSEEIASDAISAGVTDYLQKERGSGQYAVLANRIENAVEAYRSETLLTRRTRRLERLISNLPGMVYRCRNEPEWPMEAVEGEVAAMTGYDAESLEHGDVQWGSDVIHPGDREETWARVQDSLDERGRFELSYRIRTRDGETRWMWERGRGVYDDDGDLTRIEGFITDVTERERRESRLQESSARLEALFEQSPDMINLHDADGTIAEPNARLCEKTGYDREELIGMKVWEIDCSIDSASAAEVWDQMEPGDSRRLESEYERADGSTFPVEVNIRRIDTADEALFAVISRDVSERKERERRLERFASIVSHDLRNPLNVAQGRVDLAAEECDSEHLDHVADAHERMNALIDSLLSLAQEGDLATDLERIDLADAVERAWSSVPTDDAHLQLAVTGSVSADRSRLAQLFENLFRNSVEHGGSDVTITVGDLDDGFYVADDGPGIPGNHRDSVFETGYTTSDGTGFGLAIVEQVAEAHDWAVELTESDDGGVRFEFSGVDEG
ncbi:bacterioopsin transcriptional activator [Halolamina pelagica]|uniref:histidine kinase n=1 Tax=Halolamina pelagica TaxID=699431 RepID=A0A0P7GRE2_9EURY|nr:PAS domain S-box protein [Halolamina pelagica]KPN31317.1 bacterioopsin transcriptional activator [Halolamina pelagica]